MQLMLRFVKIKYYCVTLLTKIWIDKIFGI